VGRPAAIKADTLM